MAGVLHRLGRLCARHRFVVLGAWIALAAAAIMLVQVFGAKTNNSLTLPGTDSQAAYDILAARFPPQQNGTNPFVFHVEDGKLTDARYSKAMDETFHAIKGDSSVHSVLNPISKDGKIAGILSDDERTGIMPVLLNVNSGFITDHLATAIYDATRPARDAGIQVAVGGAIGGELSIPDTGPSEAAGNLAAMVILALVLGSLVAMCLPIATSIVSLAVSLSAIGLLGHVMAIPTVGPTLATMIGIGVGIDYALFLVTKHKEGMASGLEARASIAAAVASSGSAIVFAGGTVVVALVSLSVAGIPLVSALGYASAIAVFVAVLAAITLLPAILSILGTGINRLRMPAFLRPKAKPPEETRWGRWSGWVSRRPWIAVAISAVILLPLIVPLFSLKLGQEDIGVTPTSTTERQAYDLITQGFGVGTNGPLLIATTLHPVAKPSHLYTERYDEATKLQKELEREQKQLEAEGKELQAQQAALERQSANLQERAAALEAQQTELLARKADLERQAQQLRAEAERLAAQARPILAHLAVILVRERVVEQELANTTDPARRARLQARLARLRAREANTRARLAPIQARAASLVSQAESLEAQARTLEAQGAELQAQGAELQAQKAELQAEAQELQAQADELQQEEAKAKRQEKKAKELKRELTTMLKKAGGDPRGTDPRIVRLQDAMKSAQGIAGISPPQINKGGDAMILSAIPTTSPSSDATADLVTRFRTQVLPPATADGVAVHVGGSTASGVDLASKISSRLPLVVLTVLLLSFLLLMIAFRSLLVPLQAAVVNLLTVGAALGVLTAVFQWGWGLSLVGLDAPRGTVPIASYVPLMMFAVLFGLSMDYEVFMVSRIQQRHAEGDEPRTAVTSGLSSAAHVVTAAALIMFCVFAAFIINGDPTVKQFGVGLAVAVALAGTMIVLLAPAMLVLFGRRVFWVPRFLDRILPHLDVEGSGQQD